MSDERTCCDCGRSADRTLNERGKYSVDLRPYGPGGADICFECANGSPAAEERTKAAFGALLDAHSALPGVVTLDVDGLGHIAPDSSCDNCDGDGIDFVMFDTDTNVKTVFFCEDCETGRRLQAEDSP